MPQLKRMGNKRVMSYMMYNEQLLNVIMDYDGKFLSIEEIMPPRVNYRRLQHPDMEEEKARRKLELNQLQMEAYKDY